MKCHLFRMIAQKYYDGELDPAGRAEYENHARECARCGEFDREYSFLFAALDDIETYEPSPEFNLRVMANVDVARYRVGAARKAWISIRSGWNRLPSAVRVTAAIAAVFGLFVSSASNSTARAIIVTYLVILIVFPLLSSIFGNMVAFLIFGMASAGRGPSCCPRRCNSCPTAPSTPS